MQANMGGMYVVDVASSFTRPGCGMNGDRVTFTVGGAPARETGTFQTGAFTNPDRDGGYADTAATAADRDAHRDAATAADRDAHRDAATAADRDAHRDAATAADRNAHAGSGDAAVPAPGRSGASAAATRRRCRRPDRAAAHRRRDERQCDRRLAGVRGARGDRLRRRRRRRP
ncbi:MAG: hypothetical protein U0531_07570 [Dehalococcoidia bacterium]